MSATAITPDADLWPDDLKPTGEPSPSAILRQQGYRLGERTDQVVYGEVDSKLENDLLRHTMSLSSSYLKLSRPLLVVETRLVPSPYPAQVWAVDDRGDPLPGLSRSVQNARQLRDFLKEVFRFPKTVELIRALLAQAQDLDDTDD
jgi:hypothetical protein